MFDAALIQQCADPSIEIAIVERFIAEAGSDNPLAVRITSGNRIILPEQPRNADDAVRLIQRFVGQASVRVGITQYPAGHGISDAAEISADIVDACENIRMGSALFGKVYRIAAAEEGSTGSSTFDEAVTAWRTGQYGEDYVFALPDPGPIAEREVGEADQTSGGGSEPAFEEDMSDAGRKTISPPDELSDPNNAGIRVDLSRIPAAQD
ncbi:MAG: conjugal transfer protein TraH [Mesorhizobium sp.]|nr:conjugal transfer protein TraH [Mesorhizobium sp.]MCO5164708.1 conjugal transfer protein TraH [Mesorhizobium sp.]